MIPGFSEPFRGQLNECLAHIDKVFATVAPKGTKGAEKLRAPIAEFCGVGLASVSRWFRDLTKGTSRKGANGPRPTGEATLRLMCLLTLWGYEVAEFDHIPRKIRNFAELVGFQVLTTVEAQRLLGYSEDTHLVQILLNKESPSEDKAQRMWDIWMERRAELDRKKEQARQKYPPPTTQAPQAAVRASHKPEAKPHEPCLRVVVPMMEALLSIISDRSSLGLQDELVALEPKERQTILQLSARLSSLSSSIIAEATEERRR